MTPIIINMNNIYYLINAQWNNNPVLETKTLNVYTSAVLRKFKNIFYPHNPHKKCIKISLFVFVIIHQISKFYSNIDHDQVYFSNKLKTQNYEQ